MFVSEVKKPHMKVNPKIPMVDLRAQYEKYRAEFDEALAGCLAASSFVGGPDLKAFEQEFAMFCGGGHVVGCANGTDAIELALHALLGHGDGTGEVITVPNTFIATAEAIVASGYRPTFVDVLPDTHLMNPEALAKAIGPKTRAVIPVHLYGQMAPMDEIMALARSRGLKVVEDAAQAHGALWKGRGPGHWGDAATFSFFPGKNLGAWGDGGAVFSRDADLARDVRMRANHGRLDKYLHEFEGRNSRLDGLHAAILRVKLKHLKDWNEARRQIATWYDELLAGNSIVRPTIHRDAGHVFHLYVIEIENRDRVLDELQRRGIGAGVHYPIPLHQQPAFKNRGFQPEEFPVASAAARRILSLPIFPEMTRAQVEHVATNVIELIRQ
jgi:dTDP-4-amino-4,6-dideoxygalactose transaminase